MKKTKKQKSGPTYSQMFKVFAKSIREYKVPSILSMVFVALETACECVIPYVMSILIDELPKTSTSSELIKTVSIYASILFVLAMISFGCGVTAGRFSAKAGAGFAANIKYDEFTRISSFAFNNIDKFSISSLVTRQTTDIWYMENTYMMLIRICLRAPLMLIFSIIMAVVMAPAMSWIFVVTIPILGVVLTTIIIKVLPIFFGVFRKYDDLNESVEENVRGIRVVKTYVREDFEKDKFNDRSKEIKDRFVVAERLMSLTNPTMMFSMYLSMFLIIYFGSLTIISTSHIVGDEVVGDLTVGSLSSLITYGAQILSSLMMLSMVFVMFAMSVASMKRIYEVLVEVPTIASTQGTCTEVKDGEIIFNNVSFKYKADAAKYALSGVNLTIKNGQSIGIVGGTGSSKSTLVNLISRFYDTSEGEVLVGGKNVKDYNVLSLRTAVSMVLQKNILFSGTIKENLRWGNKNATDEEIVEACKIAQADSFVETFPDKYETQILQGGSNVSGGQKQRLCIARAILKKPKVLIMDDSTSAVDTKTDALIREGLRKTLPNTTKITIAQRISSVEHCDFIIVMDDGKVNGIGTHEELLKTNAIYQEMYTIQNRIGGSQNE